MVAVEEVDRQMECSFVRTLSNWRYSSILPQKVGVAEVF